MSQAVCVSFLKYSTNSPMIQVRNGVFAAKNQKSLFPPLSRPAEGVENPAADSAQLHKIGRKPWENSENLDRVRPVLRASCEENVDSYRQFA